MTATIKHTTRKDNRSEVTVDRVNNRKARARVIEREDRRATTKSARSNSYLTEWVNR